MATTRISKRAVDAAVATGADAYIWDDELSGFGLKVTPAGRKVYLIQYRVGGRTGRTRRVTIGRHGVLTPEQARTEAKRLLGTVAAGRDPAEEKRAVTDRPKLGPVLDQFLADHVDTKRKASTAREYRRITGLYIEKTLRRKKIAEIEQSDIEDLHISMKDKPYQANRTLAVLSKFFNWCEHQNFRPQHTNPCRHIERYPEEGRERYLKPAELARLGEALAAAEANESPFVIAAIRLLALTGARLSEILTLRWEDVQFDEACLPLPDSKSGKKEIHLNPPALEVLTPLPRIDGNPYVITGRRKGAHLVNIQKPWRRIRHAAGLDDVHIHDLRHSFASVAATSGQSLIVIGALLGHTQPQTTSRYAHLAADPLREANDAVGGKIADAMSGSGARKAEAGE